MKRKAFTLIELIVTMAILAMVVVMIAGMTSFTVGRLKSAQMKMVNDALRNSLDTIGQKMNNANEKAKIDGENRYGFYYKNNILVVISGDETPSIYCTYFGLNGDAMAMAQEKAMAGVCKNTNLITLGNNVTPEKIKVTSFSIDPLKSSEMTEASRPNQTEIPRIKITLSGYDTSDKAGVAATSSLETTFTMDGENVNYLKK